jgi:maltose O-acetyltransferase
MFLRNVFNKITFKKRGKHNLIYRGVYLTHTYNLEAGDYFAAYYGVVIDARGGIKIGNNVMIGPHTMVMSFNHNHKVTDRPMTDASPIFKPTIIEDNVWISGNCSILGGVRIGSGSVISAGAIITKDVPPNSIIFGNASVNQKERVSTT